MVRVMGGSVEEDGDVWLVRGAGPRMPVPDNVIDVGNSGTSLYIGMALAALVPGTVIFTGDHQIRNRPAGALMSSINDLGGRAFSHRDNGKPPLVISGPMKGGRTSIEAVTSQYLTALLIAAPCAESDTVIDVPLLYEKPYVTMTLSWLDRLGIEYHNEDYRRFVIRGRQEYRPFRETVAADFSSATFFMVAAAITGSQLVLEGLDFDDPQGDREVADILRRMGADIRIDGRTVTVKGQGLMGGTFDLNDIPDALPALAVAGCFAEGETRLVNVAQARLKETDRISVMRAELSRLGASIEELPDGLVIRKSPLSGAAVHGHYDHRVVMSLAVAGLACEGELEVDTAEAVSVTFPGFFDLMKNIGAVMEREAE
jgi:3-phosphoshikimate 1-carboxyvinyltransferase